MFGKFFDKMFGISAGHKEAKEIAAPLAAMLDEAKTTSTNLNTTITNLKEQVTELEGKLVEINKLTAWLETGVPSVKATTE